MGDGKKRFRKEYKTPEKERHTKKGKQSERQGRKDSEKSYPGSVSVTGKRSVVCCSHIQVLMQHLSHLPQLLVSVCLQVGG